MAQTPAERQRAYRERLRKRRLSDTLSDAAELTNDELNSERAMSVGEKLLTKQIALCNQELGEFEDLLRGVNPPWLRAIEDRFGQGSITLDVSDVHASIDRKRSTLARLLSELRQYGSAAAKASAGRTLPTTTGAIPNPAPTAAPTAEPDDEYRDLFAV